MDMRENNKDFNPSQLELKGFSRSVAELEWLLLALSMLVIFIPDLAGENQQGIILSMTLFAAFIMAFHYWNFYTQEDRWKIAIETWVMIAFITSILWFTGKTSSPYLNAYLLVIIASSLTLGKVMTLLEMGLICCIYFYMGYSVFYMDIFSFTTFSELMLKFTPFLLVAYLTTMLSADMRYAKQALIKQAEIDELTGILNMRGFHNIFEHESCKSERYQRPYSIMMLDADNLKQINDTLGHEAGNQMIQMLVSAVQGCLRNTDVLARYGGDEFIVLMPETNLAQARIAGERICAAVANTSTDLAGRPLSTTVSVGIASCPDDTRDASELIEMADRAMYQSKQAGRNRVSNYSRAADHAA